MNAQLAFSTETYRQRRKELKKTLGRGIVLLLGNDESSSNFKDNWYPFRQDSSFLYYTGIPVPNLALIIDVDSDKEILFGNELSVDDIIWTGPLPSLQELADQSGIEWVYSLSEISKYVRPDISFLPPYRPEHTLKLSEWLHSETQAVEKKSSVALIKAIASQRSKKSSEELELLDNACTITSRMHRAVMTQARVGMFEYELVGIAQKVLWEHHASTSFQPIMTIKGNVLHNHSYGNKLGEGRMLLFDGGAELQSGYCGDMTRTIPTGSRFSTRQRDLYNIVYAAYNKAISLLRPKVRFRDVHLAACAEMVDGLKQVGLMKGDTNEAVSAGAHTMFFQCGLGHMMGLDVHDMENLGEQYIGYTEQLQKSKEFGLKSLRLGKELEEGYVLTVEPGIYIIPELIDLWSTQNLHREFINYDLLNEYRDFGGIRLENDVAITGEGCRLLGEALPLAIDEVEAMRG